MKIKTKYLSLTALLLLANLLCTAQNGEFIQYTTADGLSNNAVLSLYQDEYGMIWAGTRNGLNQYTGNGFNVYKYRKGDPHGIHHNYVGEVTGNRNGKIYATASGITELDLKTGEFNIVTREVANALYWHEALYAGIGRKVMKYDGQSLKEVCEVPQEALGILSIGVDDDGILIGTEGHGLYKFDGISAPVNIVRKGRIASIFKDRTGTWWAGSWHEGLYIIDGKGIKNIRQSSSPQNGLSSDFVRCFCQDSKGDIWIGTFNGINVYNPETGTFTWYSDSNAVAGYSSVWSLICDKQGNVWAGTYFDGMYLYPAGNEVFTYWKRSSGNGRSLSSNMVREFTQDSHGNLWVATDGGGLGRLDPKREKFTWYRQGSSQRDISHDNVTSLYYDDSTDRLWIGTHLGGLNCLNVRTGNITKYSARSSIASDVVKEVCKYGDRLLLITDQGLSIFDPRTRRSQLVFEDSPEWASDSQGCMVDSEGRVWIYGGGYGVYLWSPDTGKIKRYSHNPENQRSLCSNSVSRVFQDSRGRIWLCNRMDGIDLYCPETDDFTNLDEASNSLASNCVYNTAELPSGRLIFTTDAGISILTENSEAVSWTFTNYDRTNGIPLTAINETALYITSNEEIFIGADNGMMSFHEENLDSTPTSYTISPFRLSVQGEEIHPGGKDGILEKPLMETRKLVLKASQEMLSIEYVTSDFVADDEKNLEYFMEGLSKEWTSMGVKPIVTFSHLKTGKYSLTVRPKNSRYQDHISSLEIIKLPPWYQSWWAILLYIMTGTTILYYIIKSYKNHVHLREALKYEKSRAEDTEALNQTKIRFFTNISHEFRTPLTLITGNTEMLMQVKHFPPEVYNKVMAIWRNCEQMQELITELLDFSKLGTGHMKIRVFRQNLVKFTYETFLLFKEYAIGRKISFDFVKTEDPIELWFDPRQLQKVLNNLISNAFKHTPDGGRISVVIRRDGPFAVIEVNDNGTGIPPQDIERIFERFYQSEYQQSDSYTGTGIGLYLTKGIVEMHHGHIEVYSQPDEGASFKVFLRTGSSHFTEDELIESPSPKEEAIIDTVAEFDIPPMSTDVAEPVVSEEDSPVARTPENGKCSMLIAEDNEDLREMLVKIFEPTYNVTAVADGKEAWKAVQATLPDIVLSDIVMPGMSGTDLCRMIKTDISTCHIPVVMLTARTTIQQNLEGLYAGADDYISKPFNVNILMARCINIVNNRAMLRDKFSREMQATPQMLATNPLDKKLIERISETIEKHLDDGDFGTDTLVSEVGISRTRLFAKLKSITGMTPAEFILTFKLKKAAIMLRERPQMNISEISDSLGFSSPRQFTRFFKEKYGMIPKEFRRSLSKTLTVALVAIATAVAPSCVNNSGENSLYGHLGKARCAPAFESEGYWVWGSSAVEGDDGKYHLFVSRFPKSLPFHPGWMVASEIVHAVADEFCGPYSFSDVALPARGAEFWDGRSTHNPRIFKYDGKYYLFYMGSTHPYEEPEYEELTLDSKWCWTGRANKRIGLAVASSPYGPWTRFDEPVLDVEPGTFYSFLTSNPSPVILEDGSVTMIFKGRAWKEDGGYSGMALGVARAPKIEGPYTVLNDRKPILRMRNEGEAEEDPFLWHDKKGYHLIFKDHKGLYTGERAGGVMAHSEDGVNWTVDKHPKAYSRTVEWEDGSVTTQGQMERPFIFFDKTGKMRCIFFATMDGPGGFENASKSWNMVIPIED